MKTYKFNINKEKYKAKILEYKGDMIRVEVNGNEYKVELEPDRSSTVPKLVRSAKRKPEINISSSGSGVKRSQAKGVKAPIPGLIHTVLIKEGDRVNKGDAVIILEAMKMESEITSNTTGKVKKIMVKEGDTVQEGDLLIEVGE